MSKEIKIYCKNRIINRGEVIGTVDSNKEIETLISDYINCIGIDPNKIEAFTCRDGVVLYQMQNISHLVFVSMEEGSFYDFY